MLLQPLKILLQKVICLIIIVLFCTQLTAQNTNDEQALRYIEKYKALAIAEQMRTNVPAAITLAQGLHESDRGMSELATQANNHFGIKCKSTWMGDTYLHDDDKRQECFRKYFSAEQSYIDHSDFLRSNNRYHFLFDTDITNYVAWASGLKRAGYATNPNYVTRLVDLIEKYDLQQYTYTALSKSAQNPSETVPEKDNNNLTSFQDPSLFHKGLKGFYAKKGETLYTKAKALNIKYEKLLLFNDLNDAPLPFDMFVYTERKRKMGTKETHVVVPDETMLQIAQIEAMDLTTLYLFNNMYKGQEPETNEELALQYHVEGTPKLRNHSQNSNSIKTYKSYETPAVDKNIQNTKPLDIDNNPNIIDIEKAKKADAILIRQQASNLYFPFNKIERKSNIYVASLHEISYPSFNEIDFENPFDPQQYTDIKELKKRYDKLVYAPRPPRAPKVIANVDTAKPKKIKAIEQPQKQPIKDTIQTKKIKKIKPIEPSKKTVLKDSTKQIRPKKIVNQKDTIIKKVTKKEISKKVETPKQPKKQKTEKPKTEKRENDKPKVQTKQETKSKSETKAIKPSTKKQNKGDVKK